MKIHSLQHLGGGWHIRSCDASLPKSDSVAMRFTHSSQNVSTRIRLFLARELALSRLFCPRVIFTSIVLPSECGSEALRNKQSRQAWCTSTPPFCASASVYSRAVEACSPSMRWLWTFEFSRIPHLCRNFWALGPIGIHRWALSNPSLL
jgi:hypothetical protein